MANKKLLNEPLMRVVELDGVGGQKGLADKISSISGDDVKQGNIWSWLYRTGRVPSIYCLAVEEISGGTVTCYEMRPDVYPKPEKVA